MGALVRSSTFILPQSDFASSTLLGQSSDYHTLARCSKRKAEPLTLGLTARGLLCDAPSAPGQPSLLLAHLAPFPLSD